MQSLLKIMVLARDNQGWQIHFLVINEDQRHLFDHMLTKVKNGFQYFPPREHVDNGPRSCDNGPRSCRFWSCSGFHGKVDH